MIRLDSLFTTVQTVFTNSAKIQQHILAPDQKALQSRLASEHSGSDKIELVLLLLYVIGYVALGISLLYISLSVKISRDAKLDLSVLGNESVRNLD